MSIIDVEDPNTWPAEVRSLVEAARGASDLLLCEEEGRFRALLQGYVVRAYHCTRLLEHEVTAIRREGLRSLSRELVEGRILAAHAVGAISGRQRDTLLRTHMLTGSEPHGRDANRRDQVCLVLTRRQLDDSSGVERLLSKWGGEVVYFSARAQAPSIASLLTRLGRPAVVVALLDLSASKHSVYPGVLATLTAVINRRDGPAADVFYRAPVLPEQIEAIWQPGHTEYDRHVQLPHS